MLTTTVGRTRNAQESQKKKQHHKDKSKSSSEIKKQYQNYQSLITIQSEDINFTSFQFEKLKVAETLCFMLAATGWGCAAIAADLTYLDNIYEEKKTSANLALISCSITTVLLLVCVIWRTLKELRFEQAKGIFSYQDTIFTTKKYNVLIVELAINFIHPSYGLDTYSFSVDDDNHAPIHYTYIGVISIIMLVRIYHFIRFVSVIQQYRSPRSQRLCQMNGCRAGTWYSVKCLIQESPNVSMTVMMIGGILVFAYPLRIFERSAGQDFASYENSAWCIILTMTTVGYGDYFPLTDAGRLIVFFACIWGVVVVSLIVVTLSNQLILDCGEENSLLILKRLRFKEEMKQVAAFVLTSAMKYRNLMKINPNDKGKLEMQLGKFRYYLNEFRQFRIKQRSLYEFDSFEDRVETKMLKVIEDMDEIQQLKTQINHVISELEGRRS